MLFMPVWFAGCVIVFVLVQMSKWGRGRNCYSLVTGLLLSGSGSWICVPDVYAVEAASALALSSAFGNGP